MGFRGVGEASKGHTRIFFKAILEFFCGPKYLTFHCNIGGLDLTSVGSQILIKGSIVFLLDIFSEICYNIYRRFGMGILLSGKNTRRIKYR